MIAADLLEETVFTIAQVSGSGIITGHSPPVSVNLFIQFGINNDNVFFRALLKKKQEFQ